VVVRWNRGGGLGRARHEVGIVLSALCCSEPGRAWQVWNNLDRDPEILENGERAHRNHRTRNPRTPEALEPSTSGLPTRRRRHLALTFVMGRHVLPASRPVRRNSLLFLVAVTSFARAAILGLT
jgi:hypothetical protein